MEAQIPRTHIEISAVVIFNSRTDADRKMLGAADQPVQTSQRAPGSPRERVSKNKVGSD